VKLAFAILLTIVGCQIRHASDQYACDDTNPCEAGRVCDNGYCIVVGSIDAAKPPGDGGNRTDAGNAGCPPGCTTCSTAQKTCTINCQFGGCDQAIACPAGYKCDILCNTDSACKNGVNCTSAAACNIECSGKQSCQNIDCGPGPCDVGCSGTQSCRDVACNNSCACDVACTGSQACEGIACTSFACRKTVGLGCTSEPTVCNSCP